MQKINFAKGYTQHRPERVFIISKIKNIVPKIYVISDINGEPVDRTFNERELQKTNQRDSE